MRFLQTLSYFVCVATAGSDALGLPRCYDCREMLRSRHPGSCNEKQSASQHIADMTGDHPG